MNIIPSKKRFSFFGFFVFFILLTVIFFLIYPALNRQKDHDVKVSPTLATENNLNPTLPPTTDEQSAEKEKIVKDVASQESACNNKDGKCFVDKIVGNYAKGNMPFAYWIAEKVDNIWKVRVTGNGIPECAKVDIYTLPKEIYGNCIKKTGELRFN